jgi:hypothetical protein
MTTFATILIVNVNTGEILEREFNDEEISAQELLKLHTQTIEEQKEAKAAARASALAKLADLGLNAEEIAAL